MFPFHVTGLPCGAISLRSSITGQGREMNSTLPPRKHKGGRRKGDPADVRNAVIGVRVSAAEYAELCQRSTTLHMKPAQWLRTAALTRRIPSPPVAAINREQYVELARLSANLNQLTRLANEGRRVTISDELLLELIGETRRLRRGLIGLDGAHEDDCQSR